MCSWLLAGLVAVTFMTLHFLHFLHGLFVRLVTFLSSFHRVLIDIIHIVVADWTLGHCVHLLSVPTKFITTRLIRLLAKRGHCIWPIRSTVTAPA